MHNRKDLMQTTLFFIASGLGAISFHISMLLWPSKFQRYEWSLKYMWIACAFAWLLWLVNNPKILKIFQVFSQPKMPLGAPTLGKRHSKVVDGGERTKTFPGTRPTKNSSPGSEAKKRRAQHR
jgi:hypothetical protein